MTQPTQEPESPITSNLPEPVLAQTETDDEGRIGYGRYARYSPIGLAILILAGILVVWWWQGNPGSDESSPGGNIGKDAPAVTLTTFDDNTVELASLRGSVVVVNFWAEWCAPCRTEMSAFQDIYEQTQVTGEPVVFLGVNLKNDYEENAQDLIKQLGITYITGPDNGGTDPRKGPIELAFAIPGVYPTTVIITPDGKIDSMRFGAIDETELRQRIKHAAE